MIRFLIHFSILLAILIAFVRCNNGGTDPVDPPIPEVPEQNINDNVTPNDFLSEVKYEQLVIEAIYIDGHQPDSLSIYKLVSFLDERIHKPKGIQLYYKPIPKTGKTTYSIDDLKTIEANYREKLTNDTLLTAWIFFTNGDYAGNNTDEKKLGLAYGASSFALFKKTIQEYSGGENQPTTHNVETTVLKHEFGHLFGLVNNGTPMINNHLDSVHSSNHCSNPRCLMYYAAETNNFSSTFSTNSTPALRSDCIEDLRNNGSK